VIFAAENSNKFQKTRFWKQKSVEDVVTLGPMTQATLVYIIKNPSRTYSQALADFVKELCWGHIWFFHLIMTTNYLISNLCMFVYICMYIRLVL